MSRTSLAISPSKPSVIYAISSDQKEGVLGVFRSDNGGATWTNVAGTHFVKEEQMSYGNAIAVHPTDPRLVICGGVDLHLTRDDGKNWIRVTKWDAERGKRNYAHADHHCLLMPLEHPGLVYDMNDGGMDVSVDGGLTWANRSNGLAVSMFYDVDVSQRDGRMFGGGLQDNGTNLTRSGKPDDFVEITGGDGAGAQTDTYPGRPVRLIVPFAAGGLNDVVARLVAPYLERALGQPFIIDNRPAASGIVGTDATAKATPDGYTLLMVASSFTVIPATHQKVPYDAQRDLAPIVMVAKNALLFLVNPKVPAKSLAEFVTLAKADPGKFNYASPGAATQNSSRSGAVQPARRHQAAAHSLSRRRARHDRDGRG